MAVLKRIFFTQKLQLLIALLLAVFTLSSCELVGDIFEAGVWTGVIIVALVIALLIYLFAKLRKR